MFDSRSLVVGYETQQDVLRNMVYPLKVVVVMLRFIFFVEMSVENSQLLPQCHQGKSMPDEQREEKLSHHGVYAVVNPTQVSEGNNGIETYYASESVGKKVVLLWGRNVR